MLKSPILEILAQYKQLTRRRFDAMRVPRRFFFLEVSTSIIVPSVLGITILVVACDFTADSLVTVTGCLLILARVWLSLFMEYMRRRDHNEWEWRMSFADEQTSTEHQYHGSPQFSQYTRFSWWKKLLQGPRNALRRRRYTGVPAIPLEPIQSNIDEPPGPSAQGS